MDRTRTDDRPVFFVRCVPERKRVSLSSCKTPSSIRASNSEMSNLSFYVAVPIDEEMSVIDELSRYNGSYVLATPNLAAADPSSGKTLLKIKTEEKSIFETFDDDSTVSAIFDRLNLDPKKVRLFLDSRELKGDDCISSLGSKPLVRVVKCLDGFYNPEDQEKGILKTYQFQFINTKTLIQLDIPPSKPLADVISLIGAKHKAIANKVFTLSAKGKQINDINVPIGMLETGPNNLFVCNIVTSRAPSFYPSPPQRSSSSPQRQPSSLPQQQPSSPPPPQQPSSSLPQQQPSSPSPQQQPSSSPQQPPSSPQQPPSPSPQQPSSPSPQQLSSPSPQQLSSSPQQPSSSPQQPSSLPQQLSSPPQQPPSPSPQQPSSPSPQQPFSSLPQQQSSSSPQQPSSSLPQQQSSSSPQQQSSSSPQQQSSSSPQQSSSSPQQQSSSSPQQQSSSLPQQQSSSSPQQQSSSSPQQSSSLKPQSSSQQQSTSFLPTSSQPSSTNKCDEKQIPVDIKENVTCIIRIPFINKIINHTFSKKAKLSELESFVISNCQNIASTSLNLKINKFIRPHTDEIGFYGDDVVDVECSIAQNKPKEEQGTQSKDDGNRAFKIKLFSKTIDFKLQLNPNSTFDDITPKIWEMFPQIHGKELTFHRKKPLMGNETIGSIKGAIIVLVSDTVEKTVDQKLQTHENINLVFLDKQSNSRLELTRSKDTKLSDVLEEIMVKLPHMNGTNIDFVQNSAIVPLDWNFGMLDCSNIIAIIGNKNAIHESKSTEESTLDTNSTLNAPQVEIEDKEADIKLVNKKFRLIKDKKNIIKEFAISGTTTVKELNEIIHGEFPDTIETEFKFFYKGSMIKDGGFVLIPDDKLIAVNPSVDPKKPEYSELVFEYMMISQRKNISVSSHQAWREVKVIVQAEMKLSADTPIKLYYLNKELPDDEKVILANFKAQKLPISVVPLSQTNPAMSDQNGVPISESNIESLVEMGFEREASIRALKQCNDIIADATEILSKDPSSIAEDLTADEAKFSPEFRHLFTQLNDSQKNAVKRLLKQNQNADIVIQYYNVCDKNEEATEQLLKGI